MRAALYWVPAAGDPLFVRGSAWLGRDIRTGAAVTQPPIPGIAPLTADAGRYGLHATLRAPMRLVGAWEDFMASVDTIAQACTPFELPPLRACEAGGFLALRATGACPSLRDLADRCVLGTEAHRAPPGAAELARRRAAGLTPRENALLESYGYPYVMDAWFFHITLTRHLDEAERARLLPLVETYFAPVLSAPRMVDEICVCVQENENFAVAKAVKLRGSAPEPASPVF